MISMRQEIGKNPTENLAVSFVQSFVHSTLECLMIPMRQEIDGKKKTTD
jgi:hypothetical protein